MQSLSQKVLWIVELYTDPPPNSTVVCVDELGSITPRAFPRASGWSLGFLDPASKRPWNTASRPGQGMGLWRSASRGWQVDHVHLALAKLQGLPEVVGADRAIHSAGSHLPNRRQSQDPQEEHYGEPMARRPSQDRSCVLIPKGAAWLNLIEAWWRRLFRRQALAGVDFADGYEVDKARRVATRQLNRKASPWVWGRPPKPPRYRRRTFVYPHSAVW